jgi:hypothetical protein
MTKRLSGAIAAGLMLPALSTRNSIATAALIAVLSVLALRFRRLRDWVRPVTIATLIAVGLGCGSQETSDSAATAGSDPTNATDRTRPASRRAHVEYVDGLVTVHSDGSLQIAVLEQLAAQAGFAIIAGGVDARPISLQIERVALLDAIALILEGLEYSVEYALDEASGTRFLAQVTIANALDYGAADPEGAAASGQMRDLVPGEQGDLMEHSGEVSSAEQAEMLAELDNADPDARIDAVFWIGSDQESIERMISMLQSDPDAEVRASIVDRLGDEESPAAIAAVTAALQDRDPEVVLRAIEVLEFEAGDWLIPELERLLTHPDPEVREIAEDTITYLK